jgi:hypothetical protein
MRRLLKKICNYPSLNKRILVLVFAIKKEMCNYPILNRRIVALMLLCVCVC